MVYTDIHLPLAGFIALDWTSMTVALLPIILRMYLRVRSKDPAQRLLSTKLSDMFIVLAWLSGMVLICINTWKNTLRERYVHWPKNQLSYGVPDDQAPHLLYISWISLYFIYISLWSSKAAFLALYYSVFSPQGKRARYIICAGCVFTAATFLVHMLLLTLWCAPISANWGVGAPLCSAVHSINSVTISTFTNVATDIVILSIPISTLVRTSFGKRELSGLIFVFLMGSVSIVAALIRFVLLKLIQGVPRASITHTIDVWALVEIVSSLLAVCAPSLRIFVRNHQGSSRSRSMSPAYVEARTRSESRSGSVNTEAELVTVKSGLEHSRTEERYLGRSYGHDVMEC